MGNLRGISYYQGGLEESDNNILTINYMRLGEIDEVAFPAVPAYNLRTVRENPPSSGIAIYTENITQDHIDNFFGSEDEFDYRSFTGGDYSYGRAMTFLVNCGGQAEGVYGGFNNVTDMDGVGGGANSKSTLMAANFPLHVRQVLNTSSGGAPLPAGKTQRVFLSYPASGLYVGDKIRINGAYNMGGDAVNPPEYTQYLQSLQSQVEVSETDGPARADQQWIAFDIEGDVGLNPAGGQYTDNRAQVSISATTPMPLYQDPDNIGFPLNRIGVSKAGNIAATIYHTNLARASGGPGTLEIYWRSH